MKASAAKPTPISTSISETAPRDIAIPYVTQDRTAPAPSDYIATSGVVLFAPGQSSATLHPHRGRQAPRGSKKPMELSRCCFRGVAFAVLLSLPAGLVGDTEAIAFIKETGYEGVFIDSGTSARELKRKFGTGQRTRAQAPIACIMLTNAKTGLSGKVLTLPTLST